MSAPDREERFRRLFLAEYRHVLAYSLRRTSDLADAQDVVADTFTVAWRRIEDAPEDDDARSWLFAIARRAFANQRRSRQRRSALRDRLRLQPPVSAGASEATEQRQQLQTVLDAFARLSRDEQEVLRLALWEDLSHRELGIVLGCTENAAAIRLHRARRRLLEESMKDEPSAGHSLET